MSSAFPGTDVPYRMSVETFRARQRACAAAVALDVRAPKDWGASDAKIPGALWAYPEIRIDPHWPKDRLILVYCNCPQEATSAPVVLQLREMGFTETYALLGGFDAWRSAGSPVERKVAASREVMSG